MKPIKYLFGALLLSATVAVPMHAQVVSNDNEDEVYKIDTRLSRHDYVPGQVLVKFKDGSPVNITRVQGRFRSADRQGVNAVLQQFGVVAMDKLFPNEKPGRARRKAKAYTGEVIADRDLSQLYQIEMANLRPDSVELLVDALSALPEVEFAEPNYRAYIVEAIEEAEADVSHVALGARTSSSAEVGIVGVDTSERLEEAADPSPSLATIATTNRNPYFSQQWYLTQYGVNQLWTKPVVNSKRPVIAIIDTGVDLTHPDLVDNLWTNTAEAEGEEGYDNDGNGFKSDVHGWDFINNTGNIRDNNKHGTHVAGIAAATNNSVGIIGANPQALIMPVSVMQSDGTGDIATIVKGINYAVQMGADVLNLSLGSYSNSRALRQALERAYQSAVIVAAAGNDGRCVNSNHHPSPCYGAMPMFPAAYSFVLGVQATTSNGTLASFSNYDDDGANFSGVTTLADPDGFNYELQAPGANILSTIPGGKYQQLNGTSMAAPLVAGAISALKMVKQYDSQEILWGDLLHTSNIAQAYAVQNRPAELDLVKVMYRERKELSEEDETDYSGDGRIDAGETVSLYPVIRTTFGEASNIKMHLEMQDEFEDASVVEIVSGTVDFGMHLDAYGKGVSMNPLVLKVKDDVADGRHIRMKFVATCDETTTVYNGLFTMVVDNMTKIDGVIDRDSTLKGDKTYLITSGIAIPKGVTLTIEPGARLEFANEAAGIRSEGRIIANGEPGKMITFTSHGVDYWAGLYSYRPPYTYKSGIDTIRYCAFNNVDIGYAGDNQPFAENCIIAYSTGFNFYGVKNCYFVCNRSYMSRENTHSNYANNFGGIYWYAAYWNGSNNCNIFNNRQYNIQVDDPKSVTTDHTDYPSYLGTSREDIARKGIYEMGNVAGVYSKVDLSNMPTRPYAEAHGIVWKVVVNGKDAQDEYEDLAPLGVGKHKFEVYFNRPMNKAVAPQISFGVRDPWTQHAVNEDGTWNDEGTIYTAYKTINGKTKSDGVNRIYVYGAEDDEFFEIPYEKTRFNINIQAAGSMATGFAAQANLGRVDLTWNNEQNDFDDAMGFNVYRYELIETDSLDRYGKPTGTMVIVADTVRINEDIIDIETSQITDYNVTPGHTYYYYYKVLSTDLQEFDISNVVAVTPLTSEKGDANGSGDVDVADVITTVNYAAGQQPQPFIFEAADMNDDLDINILDVIGIIKKILNPDAEPVAAIEATATYTIEDGVVYVDSPVDLAGVQVQLSTDADEDITVAADLKGFEQASAWLTDHDYLFLAYNMNGTTLTAGKHAILHIGNARIAQMRLADKDGRNVEAIGSETTKVDHMGVNVMTQPGIYDLQGRKLSGNTTDTKALPKGVYIINGQKVVK